MTMDLQRGRQVKVADTMDGEMLACLAQDAYNAEQRAMRAARRVREEMLALAIELRLIRDRQLYLFLDYETMDEFLGQAEWGISKRWLYAMLSIADTFCSEIEVIQSSASEDRSAIRVDWIAGVTALDLQDIGISKAMIIAPVVSKARTAMEVREWMGRASTTSFRQLRSMVQETQAGKEAAEADYYWGGIAARITGLASRLPQERDRATLLDQISDVAMDALSRLGR